MASPTWDLSDLERKTLERVLDALLPPTGSFPAPSQTNMIDAFIIRRVPPEDDEGRLYPGLDAVRLRSVLADLIDSVDVTESLTRLQHERPDSFQSLWQLAVYGYYAQLETIRAIQQDLAPAYHGAPLPLGYSHAMEPWDAADPLQRPSTPRGSYIPTDHVRRVDVSTLDDERKRP